MMRDFYGLQPCLYAFEMCNILNSHFHTQFDEKQVKRALLKDLHFTYKVMEQRSTEKNDYLRAYWAFTILGSNLEQVPSTSLYVCRC